MYTLASDKAEWRWPLYQASVIIPCIYSIIEICLNKLNLRYRHWVIVLIFCVVYEAINAAGFYWFDRDPAYPNLLEWDCFEAKETCNLWTNFCMFQTMFIFGMVVFSFLMVTIHRYKIRCCCWKGNSSNSIVKIHMNDD